MDVVLLLPGVGGMGGVAPVDMKVVFLTTSLCKKLGKMFLSKSRREPSSLNACFSKYLILVVSVDDLSLFQARTKHNGSNATHAHAILVKVNTMSFIPTAVITHTAVRENSVFVYTCISK